MNATAREAVDPVYRLFESSQFWRAYVALSLLTIAAVIVFIPRFGFGIDRFQPVVKYHRLSLAAQARLKRILQMDYGDDRRSRQAGYAFAILAVVLAITSVVPTIPSAVTLALGIVGVTAAALMGFARRRAQGPRRGAALAPRGLPRPMLVIGICDIVAMLCFAIDPVLRAGSLLVAAAIAGMLFMAWQLSATRVSFRGSDPTLETAVATFVRADQILLIALLMTSMTFLCSALAFAPHHLGAASIVGALIRLGAMAPLIVATLSLRSLVKQRDFTPLAFALETAPA